MKKILIVFLFSLVLLSSAGCDSKEEMITVPDVTNMTINEAKKELKDKGFEVSSNVSTTSSNDVQAGKIAKTEPKKGMKVNKGTEVLLYMSVGEETYPDMVKDKWTIDRVNDFCEEHELKCEIELEENADYDKGTVFYQSRQADSYIMSGSSLTIKIAK